MEINSNISSTVAASISKLNLNTAHRAFEAQKSKNEESIEEVYEEEASIQPADSSKLNIDVEDIQKYAKYMGENLSIDDINYGLMYGRSVIADYSI